MSLRDCITKSERYVQPDGRILYVSYSTEHPDYPVTDKAIRMTSFKVTMITEHVGKGISFLEFSTLNLGGWFPQKLIDKVMGSLASKATQKVVTKFWNIQDRQ